MLLDSDSVAYAYRLVLGVNGSSGISFLLGVVPIRLISRELKIKLASLHLCLLETEKIGVKFNKNICEPLATHSPEAVHIP